jgi:hypothetical protein
MVPPVLTSYSVGVMAGCWEHPLPTPFFPRVRIFALKRIRESNSAQVSFKIALALSFYQIKVLN